MSPLPVNNALEDKIAYPEILESSSYPPEGLTRSPLLNKPLHVLPYLLVLAILFVYQAGLETLKCKSSNCTVSVLIEMRPSCYYILGVIFVVCVM